MGKILAAFVDFFRPGSFIAWREVAGIAIFLFLAFVLGLLLGKV